MNSDEEKTQQNVEDLFELTRAVTPPKEEEDQPNKDSKSEKSKTDFDKNPVETDTSAATSPRKANDDVLKDVLSFMTEEENKTIHEDSSFVINLHNLMTSCEDYCNKLNHYHECYKALLDIKTLLLENNFGALQVKEVAESCFYKQMYVRSMILFVCEAKILGESSFKNAQKETVAIKAIQGALWHLNNIVNCIKTSHKAVCRRLIVPIMKDSAVKVMTFKQTDKKLRTITTAWCLKHIAVCYDELAVYWKFRSTTAEGIRLVEDAFGEDAGKHIIYGALLNNFATANDRLGKKEKAVGYYEKSIKAKLAAEDWPNKAIKFTSIQQTYANLELVKN